MGIRTAGRMIAEELCEKYPDHSNLGLAKKLRVDHPECFSSVDSARAMIRVIRGAIGKAAKKWATQPRPKGKAGTKPQMPPTLAEPWLPFDLGCGRIGSISDVHIPYHWPKAFEAAVKDLKKRKIDTLLINGDFADFYQVSRWQKNPKHRRFSKERESVIQGLEWLRSEFGRDCRIVYKMGNHEERWNIFVWNQCPEIYDLPQMKIDTLLEFARIGIEMVEDQRPCMAGKLPIFHGHELPKGLTNPVNQARGAFLRTNDSTLTAHGHQTSSQPHPTWDKKEAFSWSQGCLCEMHPGFARINKWNWGHAYIEVGTDLNYDVLNMRITDDGRIRSS